MGAGAVARAVSEARLSGDLLAGDVARVRQQLLRAAQQLERDAAIAIPVSIDTRSLTTQLNTAMSRVTGGRGSGITIPVSLDTSTALDELGALTTLGDDLTVDIVANVDTDRAVSELAALESLANNVPAAVVPLTLDPAPALASAQAAGDQIAETVAPAAATAGQVAGDSFGERFSSGAINALRAVSVAFGTVLTASLIGGFDRFTTIEDAVSALTISLGDAAAAGQVLADVLDVVTGTPFDLDQFARGAQMLIAFGTEAERIPAYLTAIGELAAVSGGQANQMAAQLFDVFGTISTLGRITGLEVRRLNLANVDALTILGNALGQTTDQMRALISEGVVPSEFALDALARGIIEGSEGIAGTTAALSGTMESLRQNLEGARGGVVSAMRRLGESIFAGLRDPLLATFNATTEILNQITAAIREGFEGLDGAGLARFTEFVQGLPQALAGASDELSRFVPLLGALGGAMTALGAGGLAGLPVLGGLFAPFSGNLALITAAITGFVAATPELRDVALPILADLGAAVGEFTAVVGADLAAAVEAIVPALANLAAGIGALVPIIRVGTQFAGVIGAAVVPALEGLAAVVERIPTGAITAIAGAFLAYRALTFLPDLIERTTGSLQRLGQRAVTTARETRTGATDTVNSMRQIGESGSFLERSVATAGIGVAAGFSGMALAADDAASQITGAVGAIGSVLLGFQTGGIYGAAIATGATLLGAIVGSATSAAAEIRKLRSELDGLAQQTVAELGAATTELLNARELLNAAPSGPERALERIGGPERVAEIREQFGLGLADLLQIASEWGDEWDRIIEEAISAPMLTLDEQAAARDAAFREFFEGLGATVPEDFEFADASRLLEDIESLNQFLGILDESFDGAETAARELAEVEFRELLNQLGLTEQQFRNVYDAALERDRPLLGFLAGLRDALGEVDTSVLANIEGWDALVTAINELGGESGVDDVLAGLGDIDDMLPGITDEVEDAKTATERWAEATERVMDVLSGSLNNLDRFLSQTSIGDDLRSIGDLLSAPIEIDDGVDTAIDREAERLERRADQISRIVERIEQLRGRLAEEEERTDRLRQAFEASIAQAESLGATRSAEVLRVGLERLDDRLEDERRRLTDAERDLAEAQREAERERTRAAAEASFTDLTTQLRDLAAERGVSVWDLFRTGEPLTAELRRDLGSAVGSVRTEFETLIAQGDIAGAQRLVTNFAAQLTEETAALGPDFAQEFLDSFFNFDDAIWQAQMEQMAARMRGDFIDELTSPSNRMLAAWPIYVEADTEPASTEVQRTRATEEADPILLPVIADTSGVTDAIDRIAAQPITFEAALDFAAFAQSPEARAWLTRMGRLGPGSVLAFRHGGIFEDHRAHIAAAGTWRVFAEPETGGEAYIPLAPWKRKRSKEILSLVADRFGMSLADAPAVPPGTVVDRVVGASLQPSSAAQIADAVADGLSMARSRNRVQAALDQYDRRHVEVHPGAIQVVESRDGRKSARSILRDLKLLGG